MNRTSVVAVALLGLAVFGGWYFLRDKNEVQALETRKIATRVLADYLARKYPVRRVLVISNPFTEMDAPSEIVQMERAGIAGLEEGFGSKTTVKVVVPDLKPEARANPRALLKDPETPTPLSYLVAEDTFDKLINANPGSELVVSLIGLPATLEKVHCWGKADRPRFGLLLPDLRIIGGPEDVRAAVTSGKLAGLVLPKQKETPPQPELPGDFTAHFVLVTAENIAQLEEANPRLLTR